MGNPLFAEATISSALRSLRIKTVREGRPGLEHIEALMRLRGDKLPRVCKAHVIRFRKGELSRAVLQALRDGPRGVGEVGDYVHAYKPAMPRDVAYTRVSVILSRLKAKGMVGHDAESRLWRDGESMPAPLRADKLIGLDDVKV